MPRAIIHYANTSDTALSPSPTISIPSPSHMSGPPPASTPQGAHPPPFPVYPCPPPMRFRPGEPFIPHLAYMEGQFATQALIGQQQRRIKALEAELASTRIELMRLRNMSAPQPQVSNSRVQQPMRHDSQSQQTADASQQQDEGKKASSRYWTAEEHTRFLEGLELFGQKDIKSISRHVGTRSATQVRTHAQKYYLRIQRERVKAEAEGKPPPTVPNGTPPPRKTKLSPGGNARSNSNQSNNGSHTNTHPNNSHSNSHNNSSSSTRNHIGPAPNNVSNSHTHTPVTEYTSTAPKPPPKLEQVINPTPPQPNIPYVSQPYLTSNPSAPITTSNANVSVTNIPTSAAQSPFDPISKSPMHPVPPSIEIPNCSVGNMSMGSSPVRNLVRHNGTQDVKQEPIPNSAPIQQADDKASMRSLQQGEAQSFNAVGVKQEDKTEKDSGKRSAPSCSKRSPKRRAKRPAVPPSTSSAAATVPSSHPQPTPPKINAIANTNTSVLPTAAQPPPRPLSESGGSMTNLRALFRVSDEAGPSSSKPPTLRRNGSSNSVLADLSKGCGILSRSNSFIAPNGKGFHRSNSILSLLSGIPTALRESPSTDRLLGLDSSDDKVMSTLKSMDAGGSGNLPALTAVGSSNSVAAMGDRTFSFGQLNHMGLEDLEDPGAVALALPEEQKWGDG